MQTVLHCEDQGNKTDQLKQQHVVVKKPQQTFSRPSRDKDVCPAATTSLPTETSGPKRKIGRSSVVFIVLSSVSDHV